MTAGNEIFLERPGAQRIAEAFRELPRKGSVLLTCDMARLQEVTRDCENAGFFALQIKPSADFSSASIRAWKGKSGPCYETGRSARYLGAALAVIDDDRHFISGSIRVCEKTAGVYRLPPYAPVMEVTDADPQLLARLESDPVSFNCDTLERDSAALMDKLSNMPAAAGLEFRAVLYPGPFRLLVLDDGSVVRRGVPVRIAEDQAAKLAGSDGLLPWPDTAGAVAQPAGQYRMIYNAQGAAGVFDAVSVKTGEVPVRKTVDVDGMTFASCLPELVEQLRRMIERNAPYVVFSGSDPADPLGCCPSEQVGQANRLVAAGVLSKFDQPAPPDSCTTAFFAFAGEIEIADGAPVFRINTEMRSKVATVLGAGLDRSAGSGSRQLLRLALVVLIVLAFGTSIFRLGRTHYRADARLPGGIAALTALDGLKPGLVYVVVFHGDEECGACVSMRRIAAASVTNGVAGGAAGRIFYREVNYDAAGNGAVKEWLGMAVSTVGVFGRKAGGGDVKVRMLTERVWGLQGDEKALAGMLESEIRIMLGEVGDAAGAGTGS